MSPLDTGDPRDSEYRKRMLPSVTDVVRELAKTIEADPAVLFKAARSVVAEELDEGEAGTRGGAARRSREAGAQPARAGRRGGPRRRARAAADRTYFPARPSPPREAPVALPAPSAAPKRPSADDPFQDTTSRAELNWEKDLPIQPEDAPFRSAILPIPRKSRGPAEIPVACRAGARPGSHAPASRVGAGRPRPAPLPTPRRESCRPKNGPPSR